ncbi:MAG TPA: carbohydrate ABC transporter permease [bacterium]|nr:carbohydrate ABC transporter permease [bacterium]HOC87906.1 carbohydrate ABC transporter permease [bacterium]HOZ20513.1 carbohydrate ABC transporter permease [bacterium]
MRYHLVTHFGLISFVVFLVFPLVWMVSTSLKSTAELYSGTVTLLPKGLTLEHYRTALHDGLLLRSLWNSLVVGLAATLGTILIALPSAYALARYRSLINKVVLGWILTTQVFPAILVMIPLYLVLRSLHLTDSLSGLALVYIVWNLPFVLWMLFGYIRTIPQELEEAALIDGASRHQMIYRILLPVLLPAVAASAVFAFISVWNEFFFALVLIKTPVLGTLPVELARYTGMEGMARTGPLAAASFIATLPSLLLFAIMRKWFTGGLLSGSVKS